MTTAIIGDCAKCARLAFLIVMGERAARLTLSHATPCLDVVNVRSVLVADALARDYCQCGHEMPMGCRP